MRDRRALRTVQRDLALAVSIWEFLLRIERGRLAAPGSLAAADWVEAALSRVPMHEAALPRDVALQGRRVCVEHEDPADRFLAATAEVHDLTLVTADEELLRGKGFRTLANR